MRKFRLQDVRIGGKIGRSFLFLVVIILFNAVLTLLTLNKGVSLVGILKNDVEPVQKALTDFIALAKDSKTYATNWVYMQGYEVDKKRLKDIHTTGYPEQKETLQSIVDRATDSTFQAGLAKCVADFEQILKDQAEIMSSLGQASDYEDAWTLFVTEELVQSNIVPQTETLVAELDGLLAVQNELSTSISSSMTGSFHDLRVRIILMTILSFVFALLVSRILSKSITGPTHELKEKIGDLRQGRIVDEIVMDRKDEIGEMGQDVNMLIGRFRAYSEFASQIGEGNLDARLQIASDEDVLGQALLSMRDNLKEVIEETNQVVEMAGQNGKLSASMEGKNKLGAWKYLSESINQLLGSIARPLLEIKGVMHHLSNGDLTARYQLEAEGEIKELADSLEMALDNLRRFMESIIHSAAVIDGYTTEMLTTSQEMNNSTAEIATSISEMSQGASRQVSKIEESSSLAENILKSAEQMDKKAQTINSAAEQGVSSSDKGAVVIKVVSEGMEEIKGASANTLNTIQVLEQRSEQISMVLKVITDIASQTNLLALNAAIEAAQAGDAGRGFAVVAEEVRKLAENSKNSAKEISNLIHDVQIDTRTALEAVEHTSELVLKCSESTVQANASFEEIQKSNRQILGLSKEILEATNAQRKDIKNIVDITETVVVIAEQTAAGSEEIATSATELSSGMQDYSEKFQHLVEVANDLKEGIGRFKL
jgi:methyl-accepting chemotaxis protein